MTTTTAWYILDSQRWWARWLNVLHLPYTGWHLSYVVIGASLADTISWTLLGWTLLAFFLGMGIASHCFDLLQGGIFFGKNRIDAVLSARQRSHEHERQGR